MTAVLHARPSEPGTQRPEDLVLARLHLRLGSLGLARAELEGMAGKGALDVDGLVDLAEARWRTGDLTGAGEAANAALSAGSEEVVAYVVAAEATAAVGRPAEARRLASRALELAELSVGDVFAGMPRASVWPVEPSEDGITEPLFPAAAIAAVGPPDGRRAGAPSLTRTGPASGSLPGLWDDDPVATAELPDPGAALAAGRAALAAGDGTAAVLHLALALRLAPALAPAVIELLDGQDGPAFALVRGDAYRLAGHERDARLAFASVAAGLAADRPHSDAPAQTTKERQ